MMAEPVGLLRVSTIHALGRDFLINRWKLGCYCQRFTFVFTNISWLGKRHADKDRVCRMPRLLRRKGDSHVILQKQAFVPSAILLGRVLREVTPAMPTWGLSSKFLGFTINL